MDYLKKEPFRITATLTETGNNPFIKSIHDVQSMSQPGSTLSPLIQSLIRNPRQDTVDIRTVYAPAGPEGEASLLSG